jgi:tetratricopeptide (TPR) repeat protein
MTWLGLFTWRNLRRGLVLLAVVYALLAGLHTIGDFDSGWQMATGRWVLAHHAIPSTDILSYTSPGAPWHYPPFAGALLYAIFSAWGYAGLSWFCAICCAALAAFLVLRMRGLVVPLLAMLAVPAIAYRMTPRADLFTMLLFAVFLVELWRFHLGLRAYLWALPIAMLLWVNLHPGFIAGVALMAAYLAMEALETIFPERRSGALARLRRSWPWLAATFVASLVNPWGVKIYSTAAALAGAAGAAGAVQGTGPERFVGELSGVRLTLRTLLEAFDLRNPDSSFWWLLGLAIVVAMLALYLRRFGVFLLIAAALAGALHGLRYQGLFAVIMVVVGGTIAEEAGEHIFAQSGFEALARGVFLAATAAVCLLSCVRIADLVSNRSYAVSEAITVFGAGESWWYPERASGFIEQNRLPGNIFQPYNLGGFTSLRLGPEYPDYIDGRAVSNVVAGEEQTLLGAQPDSAVWREVADRRKINMLMLSLARVGGLENANLAGFCQSSEWRPVYMDEVSVVLLRQRPENRAWIDRFQIDCKSVELQPPATSSRDRLFQFYANAGAVMYALSRDQEAEQSWSRARAIEPRDPNVHLYLAQLYQQQQRLGEAEQEYRSALDLKQSAVGWYALGRMYAAQHRYVEAEAAIANSAALASAPANNYKALAQVRLKLQQPELALKSVREAERASPFRNGTEELSPEFYAQLDEARAEAYRQLGRGQKALNWQQQAVQLTPAVASRWSKLSELARASGQAQLADEALRRVREIQQSESGAGK